MMKKPTKDILTFPTLRTVATMVAPLWLVPAATVNVAWGEGITSPWNIAALASIGAAALFVAAAFQAKSRATALAFATAAGLLTIVNTWTAFSNATHHTSDGRDHRATVSATIERQKLTRAQWVQGRSSAAMVAGEKPAAAIAAEIDQAIASDARRWAVTNHCDPASVTAANSMHFCGRLAELRGQAAAAHRRDALDAQIERLDREASTVTAPASVDPFSDATANLAAAVGLPLPGTIANALPAIRDGLRALTLELIAALGPAAWVMVCSGSLRSRTTAPARRAMTTRGAAPKPNAAKSGDHFDTFVAARIEKDAGAAVRAGEFWAAWQAWCFEHNVDTGNQKRFGQAMARRFEHDRNGGRPVYRGARMRLDGPATAAQEPRVLPFVSRAKSATL